MNPLSAAILATGLILGALAHGGIYQVKVAGTGGNEAVVGDIGAYRINRFTGDIVWCRLRNCMPVTWREQRQE